MAAAFVLDQPQVRLMPVVAVGTGGEADALKPAGVLALAEIPHPKFIADTVNAAVVDNALAVGRALLAHSHGDARASAGRHVAVEVELHAALERQTVVVESEEDDLVQLLPRSTVT